MAQSRDSRAKAGLARSICHGFRKSSTRVRDGFECSRSVALRFHPIWYSEYLKANNGLHPAHRRVLISFMRRSPFRRLFWFAFSLWLGPAFLVPEFVDHCPVHHFAASTPATHSSHATTFPHGGRSRDHASHRACTCPDQCCISASATLPLPTSRVFASVRFVDVTPSDAQGVLVLSPSGQLLLPPTTGPPPLA
jgi:hypothetical protein